MWDGEFDLDFGSWGDAMGQIPWSSTYMPGVSLEHATMGMNRGYSDHTLLGQYAGPGMGYDQSMMLQQGMQTFYGSMDPDYKYDGTWNAPDWGQKLLTDIYTNTGSGEPQEGWTPGYTYNRRDAVSGVRDAWRSNVSEFRSGTGFTDSLNMNTGRFLGRDVDGDGVPDAYNLGSGYNTRPEGDVGWGTTGSGTGAFGQVFGTAMNRAFAGNDNFQKIIDYSEAAAQEVNPATGEKWTPADEGWETSKAGRLNAWTVAAHPIDEWKNEAGNYDGRIHLAAMAEAFPEAGIVVPDVGETGRTQVHQDIYPDLLQWMLSDAEANPEGAVAQMIAASQEEGFMTFTAGGPNQGRQTGPGLDLSQERLDELREGNLDWHSGLPLTSVEQHLAGLFLNDMSGGTGEVAGQLTPIAQALRRFNIQTPQASDRQMRSRAFTGGPDSRARSTSTRRAPGSLLGRDEERRGAKRSLLGGRGRSLGLGGY